MDLLTTHKVILHKRSSSDGYLNDNNEWVEASVSDTVEIYCNVQPDSRGRYKNILPDGVRTDSTLIIRTKDNIKVTDHYTGEDGDDVEYKGIMYEPFYEEDFSSFGLMTDHNVYLVKRKDIV